MDPPKKRGRPPGTKNKAQLGSSPASRSPLTAVPQPPPPPPAHETAQRYSALMIAASWIHTPCVRLNSKDAFLLGGHISGLEALFVRCVCHECLAQSTSGAVFSLEEWFPHTRTQSDLNLNSIQVIQRGMPPVPLGSWMRAASAHYGGKDLVGKSIYVYWYGEPRVYNKEVTGYGRWYPAIIRGYIEATGEHRINYKEGNRWSPEDYLMYLPAAHVHFGPQKPKINEPPAARPAGVRSLAETSLCADSAAGGAEVPQPPPPHPSHRVEQTLMPELLPPAPAPPSFSPQAGRRGAAQPRVGVRARQPRKPRTKAAARLLSDSDTTEEDMVDEESEGATLDEAAAKDGAPSSSLDSDAFNSEDSDGFVGRPKKKARKQARRPPHASQPWQGGVAEGLQGIGHSRPAPPPPPSRTPAAPKPAPAAHSHARPAATSSAQHQHQQGSERPRSSGTIKLTAKLHSAKALGDKPAGAPAGAHSQHPAPPARASDGLREGSAKRGPQDEGWEKRPGAGEGGSMRSDPLWNTPTKLRSPRSGAIPSLPSHPPVRAVHGSPAAAAAGVVPEGSNATARAPPSRLHQSSHGPSIAQPPGPCRVSPPAATPAAAAAAVAAEMKRRLRRMCKQWQAGCDGGN
mmetsp:Transcript_9461/g.24139  ORF Transcript_9461/g.24139 Transcript_9461/m.24139 type:complete len:629 (-) Transcript_9461:323-2209(-)